jgi:hypothetical protein
MKIVGYPGLVAVGEPVWAQIVVIIGELAQIVVIPVI